MRPRYPVRRPTYRPARGRGWLWTIPLLGALSLGAFAFLRSRSAVPPSRDNLLLITLDTTRADRLGCYGHAAARTPHLDRLAAEGVRFEQALSPVPITLPAHASLLTALYPTVHGVRNNGNFFLADRFPTLATLLRSRGYKTAAFVSAFVLDRRYGLARGFETYDDRMEGASPPVISREGERRGDRTALLLASWLEEHAPSSDRPFFAWLHLYDPHEPYRPPSPFRGMFPRDPYDGEIAFADAAVASILDKLGQTGLLERTLIAVTADHGESLGEHGEETHSMFVYEGAIRVPLVLWRPGRIPTGLIVREPVRLTDVTPTLLDLLGVPPLQIADGRSLVPLLEGEASGRTPPVYAETYLPQLYMNWAPLRALRDERFKLIDAPRPELYDLANDPHEERNLYERERQTAQTLRDALDRIAGTREGAMSVGALDAEAVESLAALGHLGAGAAPPALEPGASRKDPKDVIAVFNRLRRAMSAVRDRRFPEALPILTEVLAEDPRNASARLVMGSAHMGMGRWREAVPWYRAYLQVVPTSANTHHSLAICLLRVGDRDGALREAEAALAIDPRLSDARILRGGVFAARGAHDAAIAELRQAVETDPAKAVLRLDLAKVLDQAGRPDEAQAEYEAALKARPDLAPALVGLAVLAAKRGDLDTAVPMLRRALEIDPTQDQGRFDLARLLEQRGHADEALAEYRRLWQGKQTPPALRRAARARLRVLQR